MVTCSLQTSGLEETLLQGSQRLSEQGRARWSNYSKVQCPCNDCTNRRGPDGRSVAAADADGETEQFE